jgi:hypothetical protein
VQFLFSNYLQIGNDPLALVEWFVASFALIIAVTLVYIFVLNKSPPPEGLTEAKLEQMTSVSEGGDASQIIAEAGSALNAGDRNRAVELAVKATGFTLSNILRSKRIKHPDMNISDLAYLVQSKSPGSIDITQPVYQLNLLHLRIAQSEVVSPQEAEWAVHTASWLSQLAMNSQIG